jgi:hypothetical protein
MLKTLILVFSQAIDTAVRKANSGEGIKRTVLQERKNKDEHTCRTALFCKASQYRRSFD